MNIIYGTMKLNDVFIQIKNGVMSVPSFQRGFDWSSRDMVRMYNSVVHNKEPFGAIVIWNDTENSPTIPNESKVFAQIAKKQSESQKTYLIDGQQRVTSFLMSYIWYIKRDAKHIGRIKNIYYHLDRKMFVISKEPKSYLVPSYLFHNPDRDDFIKNVDALLHNYSLELTREQERNVTNSYDSFSNIDLGTITISSNDLNEVIDVFTLINTKGKRLSPFNIVHAQYISKGKGFNLTNYYGKIIDNRANWNVGMSTMLLLHYSVEHNTISNKEILDLSASSVTKDIEFIKGDFKKLFSLLVSELTSFGFYSFDILPSDKFMYLVAKTLVWNKYKLLNQNQKNILNNWFKFSVLNNRYSSGGEGAKINGFKSDWDELQKQLISNSPQVPSWSRIDSFTEDDILEMSYGSTSLDYKYVISKMVKNIPSFVTGELLSKDDLSDLKKLNLHHIFPQGNLLFKDEEYLNSIANLTPLEAQPNIDIDNESPNIYLDESNKSVLKSCLMDGLPLNNFDEFVKLRASKIAGKLNTKW